MAAAPPDKKTAAAMKWVAEKYGLAYSLLQEEPQIMALFQTAIKEKWAEDTTGNAQAKFMSRLRETNWWKKNSDEWRKLAVLKHTDPTTYRLRLAEANNTFANAQAKVGAGAYSSHMRDQLIQQAISGGWDEARLEQAMAGNIKRDALGNLHGSAGSLEQELQKLAEKNGVNFTDQFYVNAARSVLSGQQTADDWAKWIRGQAANQYQAYAEQINAGADLSDIASNVTAAVAGELELDPNTVALGDPLVQKALTNVDDKGKPAPMALWQIKDMVRKDSRFMRTTKSQTEMASIGSDVLKSWGMWE